MKRAVGGSTRRARMGNAISYGGERRAATRAQRRTRLGGRPAIITQRRRSR